MLGNEDKYVDGTRWLSLKSSILCVKFGLFNGLSVIGQLSIGVFELGNFMHTNSRIIDSVYELHYGCLIDGFLGPI